jgi:hypothetical protein
MRLRLSQLSKATGIPLKPRRFRDNGEIADVDNFGPVWSGGRLKDEHLKLRRSNANGQSGSFSNFKKSAETGLALV